MFYLLNAILALFIFLWGVGEHLATAKRSTVNSSQTVQGNKLLPGIYRNIWKNIPLHEGEQTFSGKVPQHDLSPDSNETETLVIN